MARESCGLESLSNHRGSQRHGRQRPRGGSDDVGSGLNGSTEQEKGALMTAMRQEEIGNGREHWKVSSGLSSRGLGLVGKGAGVSRGRVTARWGRQNTLSAGVPPFGVPAPPGAAHPLE